MRIILLGMLSDTLQLSQPAGLDAVMKTPTPAASLTSVDRKLSSYNILLDISS